MLLFYLELANKHFMHYCNQFLYIIIKMLINNTIIKQFLFMIIFSDEKQNAFHQRTNSTNSIHFRISFRVRQSFIIL